MTKRKLPFDCRVGYKSEEVANRFTGEKITIPVLMLLQFTIALWVLNFLMITIQCAKV